MSNIIVKQTYETAKRETGGRTTWSTRNVMVALRNIGGALCLTPQSLADAQYLTAVQYR